MLRALDFGSDEVFFHPLEHVVVALFGELLLFNFVPSFLKLVFESLKFRFHLSGWSFSLSFLHVELIDFLADLLEFILLLVT